MRRATSTIALSSALVLALACTRGRSETVDPRRAANVSSALDQLATHIAATPAPPRPAGFATLTETGEILFIGRERARLRQLRFLTEPGAFDYVRTGVQPPRSWIFRKLREFLASRANPAATGQSRPPKNNRDAIDPG